LFGMSRGGFLVPSARLDSPRRAASTCFALTASGSASVAPECGRLLILAEAAKADGVQDRSLKLKHRLEPSQPGNRSIQIACIDQKGQLRAVVYELN
jgi:hypothetical protein